MAPRSRTRASSPCSTRSSTTCRTPLDIGEVEGHKLNDEETILTRKPSKDEPFSALAFKIAAHPFFGKLTFVRVYSGRIDPGAQVLNATKGKKERIGKLFQMHANKENPVDEAVAGHIYAMIGLKDTTTGDTLCDQANPIVLESMTFPDPVIQVSIEPKTKSDQEKLGTAIQKLAEEDPTFSVELDEETGQTVIGGMGELHLDILVDRMRREFKVEANVGKPQVAYRETITKTVEKHEFTHKKQTGGSGQFAKVIIALEPFVRRRRRDLRVREQGLRRSCSARVHPVGRRRCAGRDAVRRARRLPAGERQAHAARRCVPRRRLVGNGVQDRRFAGPEGSGPQGRLRSSSNRSWLSRSPRPRITWAT